MGKTKVRIILELFVMTLVGLFLAAFVYAETIYVHPTEGAYHTIQDGVDAAAAGDTVLVGPGNYSTFTVNKKLRIVGEAGPDMTKVTGGNPVAFGSDADGSVLEGFTITNPGGDGIYVSTACNYLTIKNNVISGSGGDGIHFYVTNADLSYATVLNNTISENNGCGINFQTNAGCCSYATINNCAALNNIISSNKSYGIKYVSSYSQFNNNIFANNDLWSNTAGPTSNVSVDASGGNIFVDPLFVNSDVGDFHLQSASECIDAGKVSTAYNDPDGTRNDLGVYGGPGAANWWPYPAGGPVVTNLSVTPPSVAVGGTLTLRATGKIR